MIFRPPGAVSIGDSRDHLEVRVTAGTGLLVITFAVLAVLMSIQLVVTYGVL